MDRNILVTCSAAVDSTGEVIQHPSEEDICLIGTSVMGFDLWLELHLKDDPTEKWFAEWCKKVPRYGACGCRTWLEKYVAENPPRFDDWPRYTWELHNAVNAKLERAHYPWEQYQAQYLGRWKQVNGHRIAIASVNYESLGGTETFHQTLVPKLPGVIGFASVNPLRGDTDKLGVPCGQGIRPISSLAMQCDTMISWNIDWETLPRPKKVLAVHHGSIEDEWGTKMCLQGDEIVCVNRDVAEYLKTKTSKPVHCIEPAVDPDRIKPRNQVETKGKKICLWSHRFSKEKRPELAIAIAKQLPDDWHMVLTGHRGEKLEKNDRVTILSPAHPGDWLRVASCFLSTTTYEGFGLSVAEAVAAGVPVVSTATGISRRPGIATTLPIDAKATDWAAAIVASSKQTLPSRELFGLDAFLTAWQQVTNR